MTNILFTGPTGMVSCLPGCLVACLPACLAACLLSCPALPTYIIGLSPSTRWLFRVPARTRVDIKDSAHSLLLQQTAKMSEVRTKWPIYEQGFFMRFVWHVDLFNDCACNTPPEQCDVVKLEKDDVIMSDISTLGA